ncbi:hypothetical protein [Kordiimonas aquimaris]|uniref:hypothetical protein n=1 Tax=Kordiimonas aquimaris TaxID=707591 RepID=UPI0021D0037F|nr:hypothetical protein [Kordiimonas aquimaris]
MNNVENGKVRNRNTAGHALIWAALMIASALVIKDEKAASSMLFLLFAGWTGTVVMNGGFRQAMACEAALFRRILGRDTSAK